MSRFLEQLLCPHCFEPIKFVEEKIVGQAPDLIFSCACHSALSLNSSDISTNSKHRQINDWFQIAMFELGCHYESARSLCANLDLPPPVSCQAWNQNKSRIHCSL